MTTPTDLLRKLADGFAGRFSLDDETGETITVKTGRPVQPLGMLTAREAAEVIRDLVRIAMCHEIDEAIEIDGEHPFHPHRKAVS